MMSDTTKQVQAQMASIVEMVAAMGVDYERLEQFECDAKPWKAGHNMAGYPASPEAVMSFEEHYYALEFIVEELARYGEGCTENGDNERAAEFIKVAEWVDDLTGSEEALSVPAGPYEFWIKEDPSKGFTPEEAEEWESLKEAAGDCKDVDDARQRIEEDALSVEVRTGWFTPGEEAEPVEYRIVLCTGGPHVEIRGDLNSANEPGSARLMYSDWGTSLTEYFGDDLDREALLTYARVFHFGE